MNSNVDFKSELMGGVTEVLCYGTAVVVSPEKYKLNHRVHGVHKVFLFHNHNIVSKSVSSFSGAFYNLYYYLQI
jgi:hypothetical protein